MVIDMIKTRHYKNVNGKFIQIDRITVDHRKYNIVLDSDGESEYTYYYSNGTLAYYTEHRYY